MKSMRNDNTCIIYMEGRIDTSNAAGIEKELLAIADENPDAEMVIDMEQLQYISSAGLRVLMKLRKKKSGLTVTEVSRDVYEILETTGFTEILNVKKALRKVSVEGCEIIGEGGNGVVYRLDEETIIKVYKPHLRLIDVEREINCAKQAFISGIPTAITYDVVKVGDCYGAVYEMLNAEVLSKCIMKNPDNLEQYTAKFTELAKKMHHTDVSGMNLPTTKDIFYSRLDYLKQYVTAEQAAIVKSLIDCLPERNTMIHGDFHPKNVMMQDGEMVLIDMGDVSKGHPLLEVLDCYSAMKRMAQSLPDHFRETIEMEPEIGIAFWDHFVRVYFPGIPQEMIAALEGLGGLMSALRGVLTLAGRPGMEKTLLLCMNILEEKGDTFKYLLKTMEKLFDEQ